MCPRTLTRDLNPLDAAVSKLRSINGVIDVWPVDVTERTTILQMEEKASEGAGLAGLTIVNEGAKLVLQREFVVSINHSSSLRHPSKPIIILRTDENVIGQEVWEQEQIASFHTDPNAIFLGKGFVLFRDKLEAAKGKPLRFVLEPQGFPEIEAIQNVCDVVSATLSPGSDLYIKRRAGWDTADPDMGTIVIGFDSCRKT